MDEITVRFTQAEYVEVMVGDTRYGYYVSHCHLQTFLWMVKRGHGFRAINWLKKHCKSWYKIGA